MPKTPTKPKGGGKKFAWPSAPAKKVHTVSWEAQRNKVKNAKLNAPIVPGSSITERQLAQAAQAATKTQFSDLDRQQQIGLAQAASQQRDFGGPGGFYDQYLAQLAQHAAQVNNITAQANAAVGGLQQGITGLGAADLTQLQGQANQLAAQRNLPGAPAGDLTGMANQATAIRQGLAAGLGAQTASQGAAMQGYAGNLANVVAPGQKLQGQATLARGVTKARGDIAATAAKKGAFAEQYKEEQRASEAKNVLAQQIATGKSAADLAKANLSSRTSIKTAKIRAKTALTTAEMRKEIAAADRAAKAGEPNKYGIPADEWRQMTTAQRQQTIRDFAGGKGGRGKGGKGPDWVTPNESGAGLTQAGLLKDLASRAKKGDPFKNYTPEQMKKWKRKPLSRAAAETKIRQYAGDKLKNPALLRAAVDAVYDGHLSAYTVKQLIAAGYKPSQVASTLGTTTHGQWVKTPAGKAWARQQRPPGPAQTKANTQAYGRAAPQPQGHY